MARPTARKAGRPKQSRRGTPDTWNWQIHDRVAALIAQGIPAPVIDAKLSEEYDVERRTVAEWRYRVMKDWKAGAVGKLEERRVEHLVVLSDLYSRALQARDYRAAAAARRLMAQIDGVLEPAKSSVNLFNVNMATDPELVRARIVELQAKVGGKLLEAKGNGHANGSTNGSGNGAANGSTH